MEIIDLVQGSPEWHAFRADHYPASEAPVVMGAGKFDPKTVDDLALVRLGAKTIETSDYQEEVIYGSGHRMEYYGRILISEILDVDFAPIVCRKNVGLNLQLSASLDGCDLFRTLDFEHKMWNEELAEDVKKGSLDPFYYWQLEQQLFVSGLPKAVFVTSDAFRVENHAEAEELRAEGKYVSKLQQDGKGTFYAAANHLEYMFYKPVRGRAQKLIKGWKAYEEVVDDIFVDSSDWDTVTNKLRPLLVQQAKLKGQVKQMDERMAPFKESLIKAVQQISNKKTVGNGVEVTQSVRKGTLDEKAIARALKVDILDAFRKEETTTWRITANKETVSQAKKDEIKAAQEKQKRINNNRKKIQVTIPIESGSFAF